MSYTPGPWEVDWGHSFNGDYVIRCAGDGSYHLCVALADEEANARLIAAGPEMMRYLKNIIEAEKAVADINGKYVFRVNTELIDQAEALLRRIEGKAE